MLKLLIFFMDTVVKPRYDSEKY
ncbi:MAG: palindromic element RPE4 domain-containing protein [Rickettsia endosymbiont of Ecitomorpha arachnoides]|nr:palindromic element RPE4 domain-containing protein [Rickettsia endosymbiont of Sceptobius lativentris]MCC8462509.1 palindromic element RPE4 domain-containing protein [Rickettsia endosymbiont of Ecitomorpha arachnoides]